MFLCLPGNPDEIGSFALYNNADLRREGGGYWQCHCTCRHAASPRTQGTYGPKPRLTPCLVFCPTPKQPQLRASQEAKPIDNDEQPSLTGSFRVHTPGTKRRGSAANDDDTVFIQEDGLGLRVQSSRGTSGDDSASPTNMRWEPLNSKPQPPKPYNPKPGTSGDDSASPTHMKWESCFTTYICLYRRA